MKKQWLMGERFWLSTSVRCQALSRTMWLVGAFFAIAAWGGWGAQLGWLLRVLVTLAAVCVPTAFNELVLRWPLRVLGDRKGWTLQRTASRLLELDERHLLIPELDAHERNVCQGISGLGGAT